MNVNLLYGLWVVLVVLYALRVYLKRKHVRSTHRLTSIHFEIDRDGNAVVAFERVTEPFNRKVVRIYQLQNISWKSRYRLEQKLRNHKPRMMLMHNTFVVYYSIR